MAILLISLPLVAALVWVAALVADPGPYDPAATLLIGMGLVVGATVATVGMALTGGKWSRRLAMLVMAGTLLLAVARPTDFWWWAGIVVSVLAIVAMNTAKAGELARALPSATGPPDRAVVLLVSLILVPLSLGLLSWGGTSWATIVVGISAPLTALWYSRVLPGGYYVARYAWPAAALVLAFFQPLVVGIASACLGVYIAIVAAHSSVKVAFYPPTERGTAYPLPPELTPREVLDEADLDERGRRR